jgi:colanic acid biosynthesis glycosyl transferase WcaI
MRIHLISNLYSPDELAGASLFTDLAYYLRDAGHDVRVTTTFSYYPSWRLKDEDRGVPLREEVVGEIPVRRVSMYVPSKPTGLGRMRSDLSFFAGLLRAGKFPDWRPDVIVTALPMLSQCLVQRFQHIFRRIPRLIIVQDFAVDAALELGILRLPGVAWILRGFSDGL